MRDLCLLALAPTWLKIGVMHDRFFLASLMVLVLPGCTTDAEGDTDSGTSSTSGSTTVDAPATSSASSSSSSSGGPGSESSSDSSGAADGSSTGAADESSTGDPAENICSGFSFLGFAEQIYSDGTATGDPVCTTEPAACGGEVVGTWTAEASCGYEVMPNFFEEVCAGATQQITGSNHSGTRTFNEDGTFVFDLTTQLEANLQVDSAACTGLECEPFGIGLSKEPGLEMTCASAKGGGCDCSYTLELPDALGGTWDLFNDGLLLTSDDGETLGVFNYCVEGGRFSMWTPLYERTEFPDTSCTDSDDCEGQVDDGFDAVGCEPPEEDDKR